MLTLVGRNLSCYGGAARVEAYFTGKGSDYNQFYVIALAHLLLKGNKVCRAKDFFFRKIENVFFKREKKICIT